jgi:hypothetical protein
VMQLACRASLGVVLLLVASVGMTLAQDAIRYVVPAPESSRGYVLWSSHLAARQCSQAAIRGRNTREWCEDGVVPGVKPKLGNLEPGTQVERLDSTECRDMVQIRVLDGALKGQVGCIAGAGLTSVKPQ